jgi:hypothetical protein
MPFNLKDSKDSPSGARGRTAPITHRASRLPARLSAPWRSVAHVPQEQALDVINEFLARMNDVAGAHAASLMGLIQFRSMILTIEPEKRTAESKTFVGFGDPNTSEGFAYQRWSLHELPAQLDAGGPVVRALAQQWIVMVASQWNEHYRQRLADAKGIPKNDVKDPYLADVNRMRNDVIHHGASLLATTRAGAKSCTGSRSVSRST